MKKSILLIYLAISSTAYSQDLYKAKNVIIPGSSQRVGEVGVQFANSEYDGIETTGLYGTMSVPVNPYVELQFGGFIGTTATPYYDVDDFINIDLSADIILKHEVDFEFETKLVPYIRAGITWNSISNERRNTAGYDVDYYGDIWEYYYYTGDSYSDLYGNLSAGLAYWLQPYLAFSFEFGVWEGLSGDFSDELDGLDLLSTILQVQFYFNERSFVKVFYSYQDIESFEHNSSVGISIGASF